MKNKIFNLFIIILFIASMLIGCSKFVVENKTEEIPNIELTDEKSETDNEQNQDNQTDQNINKEINEDGKYTEPNDIAKYIHDFNKLPNNFITKNEATQLGWESNKGNLWEVTDEKSIGGDYFSNREGILPSKDGRKWYECDVNYNGGYRDAERLVYSNDGLIYYTNDHYETFTQLY
ncbi:MAG: ribonuclease domain-containing protein [Sedimentibacter sp.]